MVSVSQHHLCYTVTRTIGTGKLPNHKGSSGTRLQYVGEIRNNIIKAAKIWLVKCKCLLKAEINCSLKPTGCTEEFNPADRTSPDKCWDPAESGQCKVYKLLLLMAKLYLSGCSNIYVLNYNKHWIQDVSSDQVSRSIWIMHYSLGYLLLIKVALKTWSMMETLNFG